MVKKILIGLVVVLVIFLIVVAMQPNEFRIERSAKIEAPPAEVFPHVNDLHQWEDWSPWAKLDPNAKNSFEGAESGEGAVFKWAGNEEVGEGKMTIVKSKPEELVNIQLDFIKPYPGTSNAEFTFKPDGDGSQVTWAMYGKNDFMGKMMCMFMNMDSMMGGYFEKGLANMKGVVEGEGSGEGSTESASEAPGEMPSEAAETSTAEAPPAVEEPAEEKNEN